MNNEDLLYVQRVYKSEQEKDQLPNRKVGKGNEQRHLGIKTTNDL